MAISGIPPISAALPGAGGAAGIGSPTDIPGVGGASPVEQSGQNFGDMVKRGLESVSGAEFQADDLMQKMAAGGNVYPHEVLMATSKASLAVEMAVQVRNKALEAYQEIMNLQV